MNTCLKYDATDFLEVILALYSRQSASEISLLKQARKLRKFLSKKMEKGPTPYQGKGKCFGEYRCPNCNKTWSSGNSWANKGQQCEQCLSNVYPYSQRALEKSKGQKDNGRPHRSDLCEKCKEVGGNCRNYWSR